VILCETWYNKHCDFLNYKILEEDWMRISQIKVGKEEKFPLIITDDNIVVFKELFSTTKNIIDLTTIVHANGKEKKKLQEYIVRGGVEISSYEVTEKDIFLRARRTSMGLVILGLRITKINKEERICSAEVVFSMHDGHFIGNEIQDNLYEAVLNLIVRIQ